MFRDGAPEQNCGPGNGEQCQGMAEAPGQPVLDDVPDVSSARGDAGYRGDMISLERVLHTEQKPQSQNSEHVPRSPHRVASNCNSHQREEQSDDAVIPGRRLLTAFCFRLTAV